MRGYSVDLSRYRENQTLHSLGWELNHVMSAFQAVLSRLSFDAVPISNVRLHEGFIGLPIAFERQRLRTKNVPMIVNAPAASSANFTGNLAKDPHIYAQIAEFRVVLFIDPRWITTSTAFTLFRPSSGQSTFTGLGIITGVDYDAGILTVTPWALGLLRDHSTRSSTRERKPPLPKARPARPWMHLSTWIARTKTRFTSTRPLLIATCAERLSRMRST